MAPPMTAPSLEILTTEGIFERKQTGSTAVQMPREADERKNEVQTNPRAYGLTPNKWMGGKSPQIPQHHFETSNRHVWSGATTH